jgi:organic hydroperoxide reductase OsmC/OhrA
MYQVLKIKIENMKEHHYKANIAWTGNKGEGTKAYDSYGREHTISIEGKPAILGSADTPFRGDASKHNPEDMLLSSLSVCHMLWYLHLCADAGINVVKYTDNASAVMVQVQGGGGNFAEATLHPIVTITDSSMMEKANALHVEANKKCFIANSVNFPVKHEPSCLVES